MSNYINIPTDMLEQMWRAKCRQIKNGIRMHGDLEEAYLMRKELDKRSGISNPSVFVNFEETLTD